MLVKRDAVWTTTAWLTGLTAASLNNGPEFHACCTSSEQCAKKSE